MDSEKDFEKGAPPGSTLCEDDTEVPGGGEEEDPNIVRWDGPDDPQNLLNWPSAKKWGTVAIVSAITFLAPLASSMFAPGVPKVMETFHSTNSMLSGFMVSVYVLGFAFGPMIIAPLSEMYGRLPLYHSCNVLFIIFTIAAAVSSSMSQFIVFRFFMGCKLPVGELQVWRSTDELVGFGGAPTVLGGGTIADLMSQEQRGTAMGVWLMGPSQ
jgi:MFS family permease